eukprot:m51a1_g10454 hypothetical protein (305) ;mRNA; f:20393-21431
MAQEINQQRLEQAINIGFYVGTAFLLAHVVLARRPSVTRRPQSRAARLSIELQRKSFHMIGGCIMCAWYHYGLKWGFFSSACLAEASARPASPSQARPFDGAAAWLSLSFLAWAMDAARMYVPWVRRVTHQKLGSIMREKEMNKAAGTAYFVPGVLVAILAAPEPVAVLAVLFLSIGDAASSLGSAVGAIRVFTTPRKVEGSVGCFVVCAGIAAFVGLPLQTALVTSAFVTVGELLAEIIGVDDNVVLPLVGTMGVRIARAPQYAYMAGIFAAGFAVSSSLAMLVASVRKAPPAASQAGDPKAQ